MELETIYDFTRLTEKDLELKMTKNEQKWAKMSTEKPFYLNYLLVIVKTKQKVTQKLQLPIWSI